MSGGIYQMNGSNALRVIWLARSVFGDGSRSVYYFLVVPECGDAERPHGITTRSVVTR